MRRWPCRRRGASGPTLADSTGSGEWRGCAGLQPEYIKSLQRVSRRSVCRLVTGFNFRRTDGLSVLI